MQDVDLYMLKENEPSGMLHSTVPIETLKSSFNHFFFHLSLWFPTL